MSVTIEEASAIVGLVVAADEVGVSVGGTGGAGELGGLHGLGGHPGGHVLPAGYRLQTGEEQAGGAGRVGTLGAGAPSGVLLEQADVVAVDGTVVEARFGVGHHDGDDRAGVADSGRVGHRDDGGGVGLRRWGQPGIAAGTRSGCADAGIVGGRGGGVEGEGGGRSGDRSAENHHDEQHAGDDQGAGGGYGLGH